MICMNTSASTTTVGARSCVYPIPHRHAVLPVHRYGEPPTVAVVSVQGGARDELKHDRVFGVMRQPRAAQSVEEFAPQEDPQSELKHVRSNGRHVFID